MRLSRIILDGPETGSGAPLEVRFDSHIALIGLDGSDVGPIRSALESLLQGRTDFGKAYLGIDGVEIEVTPELATHLGRHIGSLARVVDAGSGSCDPGERRGAAPEPASNGAGPGVPPWVAAGVLRSALEMLGLTDGPVSRRAANLALRHLLAERQNLQQAAQDGLAVATDRRAVAEEALRRAEVRPEAEAERSEGPEQSEDGRPGRRWLAGRPSLRRGRKTDGGDDGTEAEAGAAGEEDETSGDGIDDGSESGLDEVVARCRVELAEAEAALAEAEAVQRSLAEGGSGLPQAELLAVEEFILRLRLRQFASGEAPPDADLHRLQSALEVCLELRHGIRHSTGDEGLVRASSILTRLEADQLRSSLRRRVASHAKSLPAVGTVPLVLDAPFANVGPKVAEMVMSSLDSYVGLVQIVALRPDHTLVRWAEAHGRHPAPTEP